VLDGQWDRKDIAIKYFDQDLSRLDILGNRGGSENF
jgi:hypothetical protein